MMQKLIATMLLIFLTTSGFSTSSPVLLAVGDIATCGNTGAFITAGIIKKQLEAHQNAKLAILGDIAYERGTDPEFKCFDAAYGQFKTISYPVPGNHEYYTQNATGYYAYYGSRANDPKRGYYTYKLGTWRIFALNSNCQAIGGCDNNSPQVTWLRATLAQNPSNCALAYWHHPRFSSGRHGNNDGMQDIWAVLAKAKVEMVLTAHDHTYERFVPLNADGQPNPNGTRAFVIGTGGRSLYPFWNSNKNSAVKQNTDLGIGKFILEPNSYSWEFISANPKGFTDKGTGKCN